MEGLARADDRDRAPVGAERPERFHRHVGDLDPVGPLRLVAREVAVHGAQRLELGVAELGREGGEQIDVADPGFEVAGRERSVQVQTDELLPKDALHAHEQALQEPVGVRVGCCQHGRGGSRR